MRLVFAPDSFKGSASAERICALLREAARKVFPTCECVSVPIADGGEGTLDAFETLSGGTRVPVTVTAPDGEPINSEYLLLPDGTAVIEMAKCCGLYLLPKEKRNPLYLTSYGLGELILSALKNGARELYIGIGGSATNDGGMGMLTALGAQFTSRSGRRLEGIGAELAQVTGVDLRNITVLLNDASITVISDVTNPLLGEHGATYVYGPQKGADELTLKKLENGMTVYADAFYDRCGIDISEFPGAGAAGGCGAALGGVLRARIRRGIDVILERAGFDALLRGAALVVTGEGRVDGQTFAYGKAVSGVAASAERAGVPCFVLTGSVDLAMDCPDNVMVYPIETCPMTLDCAMLQAEKLISGAAERMFKTFRFGMLTGGAI